ncbi:hypothetical protein [Peptostreptococcus russellii]|uniref:hypothetical protein n=1 Tax=Peptostreptococcus russellii TaxID=215200 RepID=UPI003F588459
MSLNKLEKFIYQKNIIVVKCKELDYFKKGALFCSINGNNIILLNENFYNRDKKEQIEILAEECGHYATTVGDITNANSYKERLDIDKAELKARQWGANYLIDIEALKKALLSCQTVDEVLDKLDISYNIFNDYMTKLSLQKQYLNLGNGYKLNLYKLPNLTKERSENETT